jgi:hypothetical protein
LSTGHHASPRNCLRQAAHGNSRKGPKIYLGSGSNSRSGHRRPHHAADERGKTQEFGAELKAVPARSDRAIAKAGRARGGGVKHHPIGSHIPHRQSWRRPATSQTACRKKSAG